MAPIQRNAPIHAGAGGSLEPHKQMEEVIWPSSLQSLSYGHTFNQRLHGVTWPISLQSISFGNDFNQSLQGVTWPSSLRCLSFADGLNQTLEGVTWPSSLQRLSLSSRFSQSLATVEWPSSLQSLSFTSHGGQGSSLQVKEVGAVLPRGLRSFQVLLKVSFYFPYMVQSSGEHVYFCRFLKSQSKV